MDHASARQPAVARRVRNRRIGLALLAALLLTPALKPAEAAPPPSASIVRATPALWIVRDADTTIYLFGTFHSLDGRTVWMENEVRAAFDRSSELVLETMVPVSAVERAREGAAAGAQRSAFLQGTRAAIAGARSTGMSVDNGADSVLRRLAEQSGKEVSGLEAFGEQLKALSVMPAGQPAGGAGSVPAPAAAPVTMTSLFASWASGDGEAFGAVLGALEHHSPQLYRSLIADRNVRWAGWIAKRLERPGIVFVAVGTGHLTGKDSVQRVLAARGIDSARIG